MDSTSSSSSFSASPETSPSPPEYLRDFDIEHLASNLEAFSAAIPTGADIPYDVFDRLNESIVANKNALDQLDPKKLEPFEHKFQIIKNGIDKLSHIAKEWHASHSIKCTMRPEASGPEHLTYNNIKNRVRALEQAAVCNLEKIECQKILRHIQSSQALNPEQLKNLEEKFELVLMKKDLKEEELSTFSADLKCIENMLFLFKTDKNDYEAGQDLHKFIGVSHLEEIALKEQTPGIKKILEKWKNFIDEKLNSINLKNCSLTEMTEVFRLMNNFKSNNMNLLHLLDIENMLKKPENVGKREAFLKFLEEYDPTQPLDQTYLDNAICSIMKFTPTYWEHRHDPEFYTFQAAILEKTVVPNFSDKQKAIAIKLQTLKTTLFQDCNTIAELQSALNIFQNYAKYFGFLSNLLDKIEHAQSEFSLKNPNQISPKDRYLEFDSELRTIRENIEKNPYKEGALDVALKDIQDKLDNNIRKMDDFYSVKNEILSVLKGYSFQEDTVRKCNESRTLEEIERLQEMVSNKIKLAKYAKPIREELEKLRDSPYSTLTDIKNDPYIQAILQNIEKLNKQIDTGQTVDFDKIEKQLESQVTILKKYEVNLKFCQHREEILLHSLTKKFGRNLTSDLKKEYSSLFKSNHTILSLDIHAAQIEHCIDVLDKEKIKRMKASEGFQIGDMQFLTSLNDILPPSTEVIVDEWIETLQKDVLASYMEKVEILILNSIQGMPDKVYGEVSAAIQGITSSNASAREKITLVGNLKLQYTKATQGFDQAHDYCKLYADILKFNRKEFEIFISGTEQAIIPLDETFQEYFAAEAANLAQLLNSPSNTPIKLNIIKNLIKLKINCDRALRKFQKTVPLYPTADSLNKHLSKMVLEIDSLSLVSLKSAYQERVWTDDKVYTEFSNIVPFKDNIVRVSPSQEEMHAGKTKPYNLNASKVELSHEQMIIAAAPTIDETKTLFWRAAFENNSEIIVDLTNEDDKVNNKPLIYYPQKINQSIIYGDMTVKLVNQANPSQNEKIKLLKYQVTQKDGGEKFIYRIHYTGWPDHGAANVKELNQINSVISNWKIVLNHNRDPKLLEDQKRQLNEAPLIIHCRAGVGRSATLAISRAMEAEARGKTEEEMLELLDNKIMAGKKERHSGFIQTGSQYALLRRWAHALFERSKRSRGG